MGREDGNGSSSRAVRSDRRHRNGNVIRLVLVAVLAGALVSGCIVDSGYSYWILNDSDDPLIVDVREQLHRTLDVPPHTYRSLFSGMGVPRDGWTIGLVDEQCTPLETWPVDPAHDLVYVDPTGHADLATDAPWSHGLRTATESTITPRAQCP